MAPVSGASSPCQPTTLVVKDLGYRIKGKQVLHGVTCLFEPRKLTAILGGSGSGKTSLLNALALQAPGTRTGEVLVNGFPVSRGRMRLLLSYMPQSDAAFEQLSVRQALHYAALLRCPRDWAHATKLTRAEEILRTLSMTSVADSLVGAISGGQRRRTSAALEFLSGRPLLFMDEPTSGLDAATAKALVDSLSYAAHEEARTVVATIHQPSWALLSKFDALVVLGATGNGGTVAFHAGPSELPGYLGSGGSPVPAGTNPADHLMFLLSQKSSRRGGGGGGGGRAWAQLWGVSPARLHLVEKIKTADTREHQEEEENSYPITLFEQYRVLFFRTLHAFVADPQQGPLIAKILISRNVAVVGLLLDMPSNLSKANAVFYYVASSFTLATVPLVVIMPEERGIVLREYRNGVFDARIYWLARFTLALGTAAAVATFSTIFAYPLLGFPLIPSKFLSWWLLEFAYNSCCASLGIAVGVVARSPVSGLKMLAAISVLWLVSAGVVPPASMVRPTVFWLHYPNLFTWSTKLALSIGFTGDGRKANRVLRDDLGIHPGNADSCYWALAICFGVLFCVGLAATVFALNRRDQAVGVRSKTTSSRKRRFLNNNNKKKKMMIAKRTYYGTTSTSTSSVVVDDVEAPAVGQQARSPVPIELRCVSYRHRPRKLAIDNVSVRFGAGTISMIIGPSGAGKTTLLALLAGRLRGGVIETREGLLEPRLQGDVLVDDAPADFSVFRRIGTLTPQNDDALDKSLTVRETLLYTAELRSPAEWTYPQKAGKVDAVLSKLGLAEVADNVVGDARRVGISGGEKKLLSIGMDLLAELPVMLVDEPTTSLDAAAAREVVDKLASLASDLRRTIACAMHQPPWASVLKFDHLVVLAMGRLVFDGAPSKLPEFLRAGGAPVPSNDNPADHAMDVLIGEGNETWMVACRSHSKTPKQVWRSPPVFFEDEMSHYAVPLSVQYSVLLRRFSYVFFVEHFGAEIVVPAFLVSLVVGLAFRNFPTNIYFGGSVLFLLVGHGAVVGSRCVLEIPTERPLVLREYRNGSYSIATYWLARATVSIATAFFVGLEVLAIWYPLVVVGFRAEQTSAILDTYFASTLNATVLVLIALVVGLLRKTPLASAQFYAPAADASLVFSGLLVTKRFIKPYAYPFFYAFPTSYAFEIALTSILQHKEEHASSDVIDYFSLHPANRRVDYAVLLTMIFFWLTAGYFVARANITGHSSF
ncbi:hypothetical protein CTAYLR_002578 [Chrysophaeum taylorii]|uniref:ABC transporter domain-containing protein n=1 Tax=Chrysophaeum taylorii TaxID=2483200 RepID=A0AAD7XLG7_9STRA|nr:hypothetical protein CTAYLR_002578 [Chrysophaeum taylorii]